MKANMNWSDDHERKAQTRWGIAPNFGTETQGAWPPWLPNNKLPKGSNKASHKLVDPSLKPRGASSGVFLSKQPRENKRCHLYCLIPLSQRG